MAFSKDLVAASATPLLLSILSRGESYGYEIIKEVYRLSNGEISWTDGMLYPVLHRLETQKLIESQTRKAENGRIRKYYRIKDKGQESLKEHRRQWTAVHTTLKQIWETKLCFS